MTNFDTVKNDTNHRVGQNAHCTERGTSMSKSKKAPATELVNGHTYHTKDNNTATQSTYAPAVELVNYDTERRIVVFDWDPGTQWNCSYDGQDKTCYTTKQMLANEWMRPGITNIVVEAAHFKPSNPLSMSQPLSAEQQNDWTLPDGVEIRLFPGDLAPKAAEFAGNYVLEDGEYGPKKAPIKSKDSQSIWTFLMGKPGTLAATKKWLPPKDNLKNEASWIHRDAIRDDASQRYNLLRRLWSMKNPGIGTAQLRALPELKHAWEMLELVEDRIPDSVLLPFGLERKNGKLKPAAMSSCRYVMSCYVCVFDENQQLRLNPNGEFVGIKYLLDEVIEMKPLRVGSVLSSNFTMHLKKRNKNLDIDKAQSRRNIRTMLQLLRDAGIQSNMTPATELVKPHTVPTSKTATQSKRTPATELVNTDTERSFLAS
jgi:hypothetical protein